MGMFVKRTPEIPASFFFFKTKEKPNGAFFDIKLVNIFRLQEIEHSPDKARLLLPCLVLFGSRTRRADTYRDEHQEHPEIVHDAFSFFGLGNNNLRQGYHAKEKAPADTLGGRTHSLKELASSRRATRCTSLSISRHCRHSRASEIRESRVSFQKRHPAPLCRPRLLRPQCGTTGLRTCSPLAPVFPQRGQKPLRA